MSSLINKRNRAARLKQQQRASQGRRRPASANPFGGRSAAPLRSPPRKSRPPPAHNVFSSELSAGPFGGAPVRRQMHAPMGYQQSPGVDPGVVNQLQNEIHGLHDTINNLQESIRNELLGMKSYFDNVQGEIEAIKGAQANFEKFMADTQQAWQAQNNSVQQLQTNMGSIEQRLSRVESSASSQQPRNYQQQPPPQQQQYQPPPNETNDFDEKSMEVNDEAKIRDRYEKIAVPSKKVRTVTGKDDDNKLELPGPPSGPPPGHEKSSKKSWFKRKKKSSKPPVNDLDEMPVGGKNKNSSNPPVNALDEMPVGGKNKNNNSMPPEQPPADANVLEELPVGGSSGPPPEDVGPIKLKECRNCGRKFKPEALARHMKNKVCQKKKRKAFKVKVVEEEIPPDAKRQAKIAEKKLAKAKKKAKWRQDRNALREAIKAGKQIAKAMKDGVDISSLPPPPSAPKHDDRVACPHCGRKFNEDVAARHVPKCNSRNKKKRR